MLITGDTLVFIICIPLALLVIAALSWMVIDMSNPKKTRPAKPRVAVPARVVDDETSE
jgi:hypothetical protein